MGSGDWDERYACWCQWYQHNAQRTRLYYRDVRGLVADRSRSDRVAFVSQMQVGDLELLGILIHWLYGLWEGKEGMPERLSSHAALVDMTTWYRQHQRSIRDPQFAWAFLLEAQRKLLDVLGALATDMGLYAEAMERSVASQVEEMTRVLES